MERSGTNANGVHCFRGENDESFGVRARDAHGVEKVRGKTRVTQKVVADQTEERIRVGDRGEMRRKGKTK